MNPPNPLDYPNDSLGWTHAVIDHARAVNEHAADDPDELAAENDRLEAENDAIRAENAALRSRIGARASAHTESRAENAAYQRKHRIRRAISGHFESKQARHR